MPDISCFDMVDALQAVCSASFHSSSVGAGLITLRSEGEGVVVPGGSRDPEGFLAAATLSDDPDNSTEPPSR